MRLGRIRRKRFKDQVELQTRYGKWDFKGLWLKCNQRGSVFPVFGRIKRSIKPVQPQRNFYDPQNAESIMLSRSVFAWKGLASTVLFMIHFQNLAEQQTMGKFLLSPFLAKEATAYKHHDNSLPINMHSSKPKKSQHVPRKSHRNGKFFLFHVAGIWCFFFGSFAVLHAGDELPLGCELFPPLRHMKMMNGDLIELLCFGKTSQTPLTRRCHTT